ncbi:MAG: hypothetical protein K0S71_1728 [Clostridia bacterium]|jgi:hypothetical protein|nr:hypothetical protein [Clostridia bacterium]
MYSPDTFFNKEVLFIVFVKVLINILIDILVHLIGGRVINLDFC